MFSMNSRYFGLPVLRYNTADGRQIAYVARRFLPQPGAFALLMEHTVTRGERLDLIANKYVDDSEQFWRICDADAVMSPFELAKPGKIIRITLPQGIPGPRNG